MTREQTQVSKAHQAIKSIIAATDAAAGKVPWRGRRVDVVQVDPGFTYEIYNDTGEPHAYRVGGVGSRPVASRIPPPPYGGPATAVSVPSPSNGGAFVTREIGPNGSITIYVPELDAATLDVARDALLIPDKQHMAVVLKALGPYAGIGAAIVESQGKTLEKVSSGKTSRQLDREISEFVRSRTGK